MRNIMILVAAVSTVLAGCAQPATDCVKVAAWIEMGIQTKDSPQPDDVGDQRYADTIAKRVRIKEQMSEHEHRFAETFQNQLNNAAVDDYAAIYALCRKWETGDY